MYAKGLRFIPVDSVYLVMRHISKIITKSGYHFGSVEQPLIVMASMVWSTQAAGDSIWGTDGLKLEAMDVFLSIVNNVLNFSIS